MLLKGEKMFASRCTGSFPRLPTGDGGQKRSRCGSFYGRFEAWLHMQLHFTAATKLITNRNAREKEDNPLLPAMRPSPEKSNAKCSWSHEMQRRHSTNFEHQVSLWFFFFFFTFFSDYFFPVCFLSLHNKSLRKAFQFK